MAEPVETKAAAPQESKEGKWTQELRTRVFLDELKAEATKKWKSFSAEQEATVKIFLEETPTFALTKDERMALIDEITGIEATALARLKDYLYQKNLIEHLATKARWLYKESMEMAFKTKIETIDATPTGLRSLLDELETNKVTGAPRYMALYYIFKRFFVEGEYIIQEDGKIFPSKKVTNKDGKTQEEMTQMWNEKVNGKEWKNIQRFAIIATSPKGKQLPDLAQEVAKKYAIELKDPSKMTPEEKSTLLARIRMDGSIKVDDKVILEWYLSQERLPDSMQKEAEATQQKWEKAKAALEQATGKTLTADDWKNALRNPESFFAKFIGGMGPIGLISTVGLVIGWLFGKEITGANSSFFMKILAVGAGIGVAKTTGLGDHIMNLIEGKDGARDGYVWAYQKFTGGTVEMYDRLVLWYKYSHFQISNDIDKDGKPKTQPTDLIDSNFLNIHQQIKSGRFDTLGLKRDDSKSIKSDEIADIKEKIATLYRDGTAKYGSEFEQRIAGKTIAEAIDFITDPKDTKPAPSTTPKNTPVTPHPKQAAHTDGGSTASGSSGWEERIEKWTGKRQGTLVNLDF